jgi:phosphoribosylformylglycinamidine synthase
MGYPLVQGLRIGKHVSLTVQATDAATADAQLREICDRLLANPVIETYQITLTPLAPPSTAVV